MNTSIATRTLAAAFTATIATTAIASAYAGQDLAAQANVTIAQARTTAQRAVPGKIVSEELEKEKGGSGLRYTFDISGAHGVREVGVDAKTGRILENVAEDDAASPGDQADKAGAKADGEDPKH